MPLNTNLDTPGPPRGCVELPPQDPASPLTFPHSLGVVPGSVSVRARAKHAAIGNGVLKGMEFDLSSINGGVNNGGLAAGGVWLSDTAVTLAIGLGDLDFLWPDGTGRATNVNTTLAAADWEIVVRVAP